MAASFHLLTARNIARGIGTRKRLDEIDDVRVQRPLHADQSQYVHGWG